MANDHKKEELARNVRAWEAEIKRLSDLIECATKGQVKYARTPAFAQAGEPIEKLATRIADGMRECCNDQNGWGRTYEFEPHELEAFARALHANYLLQVADQLTSERLENQRLRDLLRGCVEHMEYSTQQGCTAWNAANEELGPALPTPMLYSSPAQGQEDELRRQRDQLLEALKGVIQWDKARKFPIPYRVRDPIHAAIAAVEQAKEGGGTSSEVNVGAAYQGSSCHG